MINFKICVYTTSTIDIYIAHLTRSQHKHIANLGEGHRLGYDASYARPSLVIWHTSTLVYSNLGRDQRLGCRTSSRLTDIHELKYAWNRASKLQNPLARPDSIQSC